MLLFLKKIFGVTVPAKPAPAPYKVEAPVGEFPFPKAQPSEKKSTSTPGSKKTSAKPAAKRAPRKPKQN
jgi:hypothetical protein